MLVLGGSYLYAAAVCTTIINDDGAGWLYLLVMLFVWNALKMLWLGPLSLVPLLRARAKEQRARRVSATY